MLNEYQDILQAPVTGGCATAVLQALGRQGTSSGPFQRPAHPEGRGMGALTLIFGFHSTSYGATGLLESAGDSPRPPQHTHCHLLTMNCI